MVAANLGDEHLTVLGVAAAYDDEADPLGAAMSRLARTLQRDHASFDDTLEAITAAAVAGVPGATSAGITLSTGRGQVQNRAATGDLPRIVDAIQAEVRQGPCLETLREQHTVRVDDLAAEHRWPRFSARAAAEGVGSVLAFQLFVQGDNLGALNLYSAERAAFDERSEDVGLVFASHAAVALAGAQEEAGLRLALDNRDLIGQAKGILMERHKLTADQAFLRLVRASQDSNVRLRDVAQRLAATGELPT